MIKRYRNLEIENVWSDDTKYDLWQKSELALLAARKKLGRIAEDVWNKIVTALSAKPINLARCFEIEGIIKHDQQAAVEERRECLNEAELEQLAHEYHRDNTSYDSEEPAFAQMLRQSVGLVLTCTNELKQAVREKAISYRFTPMLARTHGQWAQIQSFGYMCLTWHEDLTVPMADISNAASRLNFSKMSGAVGNNAEIDPELERMALEELGLRPWHGATQIMPRVVHASLAKGLAHLVCQCAKIASDIRLGARSGYKIIEEPHGKSQKGSSAMPQKRNPIKCEQITGMARAARHFAGMLDENIETWESRSIEQSCVERIAWPDLFHVTVLVLSSLKKIIKGLNVYPDMMMKEIAASAGTYASNAAKTFLAEELNMDPNKAYEIVKLAAYNVFAPSPGEKMLREYPPDSLEQTDKTFFAFERVVWENPIIPESIEIIIARGDLKLSPELSVSKTTIAEWNARLKEVFEIDQSRSEWHELFKPSRAMKNEAHSFRQVFKI